MECPESEWEEKALQILEMYIDRGDRDRGNTPQLMSGVDLLNLIGFALKVDTVDPATWSDKQLEQAELGRLCFYAGESLKAIETVVNQITKHYKHDAWLTEAYLITILPITIYFENKLISLSLIRFKYEVSESWKFVDNVGRIYSSFEDWIKNNILPPSKIMYPENGCLERNPRGDVKKAVYRKRNVLGVVDKVGTVVGLTGAIGATVLSGGMALPFVGAGLASAIYGTGRTVGSLLDKSTHSENINPLKSWSNAGLWLGLAASCVSFGAMGATWQLTRMAVQGQQISQSFKLFVNVANGTCLTVNSLSEANAICQMIADWENMTAKDVLLQSISLAFFARTVMTYRPANQMIRSIHDNALNSYSKNLSPEELTQFNKMRKKYRFDRTLVQKFHESGMNGYNPTSMSGAKTDSMPGPNGKQIALDSKSGTIQFRDMKFAMQKTDTSGGSNVKTSVMVDEVQRFSRRSNDHTDTKVSINFKPNGLIDIGNGNLFSLDQLIEMNTFPIVFRYVHLRIAPLDEIDASKLNEIRCKFDDHGNFLKWVTKISESGEENSISVLLKLHKDNREIFDTLEELIENDAHNRGVINLNNKIYVSIFYLSSLDIKTLRKLVDYIKNTNMTSHQLTRIYNKKFFTHANKLYAQEWIETEFPDSQLENIFRARKFIESRQLCEETNRKLLDIVKKLQPKSSEDFINCAEFVMGFYEKVMDKREVYEIVFEFQNPTKCLLGNSS